MTAPEAARGLRLFPCLGALLALAACHAGGLDRAYDESLAALAERIEAEPRNRELRDAVEERLARGGEPAAPAIARRFAALEIVPLRVPGLMFHSHPQSGADLSAVEGWLERPVPLVPVDEVGTVEQNAAVIARGIRAAAGAHARVALFSASKGSADVRAALETHSEAAARVILWIDLVGVLEGTPLTNEGSPARDATAGWLPAATAESMSEAALTAAAARRRFPPGVTAIHVAAFPRVADISPSARDAFRLLRKRGPTDGYVLLESYLRAPGRVLVIRGADHYLLTRTLPRKVAASVLVALDEIEAARRQEL